MVFIVAIFILDKHVTYTYDNNVKPLSRLTAITYSIPLSK